MCPQKRTMSDVRPRSKEDPEETPRHTAWVLLGIRYGLPVAAMVAGVIIMLLGGESDIEGGAGIVGAGVAIYAMNWLYRAAVEGDHDVRVEEEEARAYLSTHGHWPDERHGA
jgi:hypothetical protein